MSEEIQLRVHGGAFRLWTVPTDDGRTLLASGHKGGAVRAVTDQQFAHALDRVADREAPADHRLVLTVEGKSAPD